MKESNYELSDNDLEVVYAGLAKRAPNNTVNTSSSTRMGSRMGSQKAGSGYGSSSSGSSYFASASTRSRSGGSCGPGGCS